MPGLKLGALFAPRRKSTEPPSVQPTPDQELLGRFLNERDDQAFAGLMQRHSAMVLQVCRRILRNPHDAEDACQAVFLVLARRAHSIRQSSSLASWLHGVAWNVAHKLQTGLARRTAREDVAAAQKATVSEPEDISWREVQRLVDEELNRMPKVYQDALVLCYLEGRTQEEAARELGWSLGALRGRLERGREMLRGRLTRRGVTGAAGLAIAVLLPSVSSASLPSTLIAATASASIPLAAGAPIPATISAPVAALTAEALQISLWTKFTMSLLVCMIPLFLGVGYVLFAEAATPAVAVNPPQPVPIWSEANKLIVPHSHVWCVAFSADGKRLAASSRGSSYDTGELRVWDAESLEMLYALPTPRSVRCVAFSPDGKTLATAEHDGIARLRDSADGKVLFTLRGHKAQIDTVAFSPDGKQIATSGWDQTVHLWDAVTGESIRTLEGHHGQVFIVAFGGADGTLASGGVDNTAKIWNPATGRTLFTLRGHTDVVHWLAFAPDGKTLASASWDTTVKLWDVPTGKPLATLQGHSESVLAVAFAPNGKWLASAAGNRLISGAPGEVILWDLSAQTARARLNLSDRVYGLAFSPDGQTLAAGCWDGTVRLYKSHAADASNERPSDIPGKLKFVSAQPGDHQAAPVLKKEYREDFHPTFKVDQKEISGLLLFGPEVSTCLNVEPNGLRVNLPSDYPKPRPGTGFVTDFGVKGDFEFTASYDVLQEPKSGHAEIRLIVVPTGRAEPEVWHKANQNRAVLAREFVHDNIGQFFANITKWNPEVPKDKWGNEDLSRIETNANRRSPTTSKSGRLRLVRNGSTLYFFSSEGTDKEFTLLHKDEFNTQDLKNLRILGSTGGPKASLDVRITDLQIRADAFVKQSEAEAPVRPTAPTPTARRGWLIALVIAVLTLVLMLGVTAGVFVFLRRRVPTLVQEPKVASRKPALAGKISFKCSSCGKPLKTKVENAGSKIKCPSCGKPAQVPDPKETK